MVSFLNPSNGIHNIISRSLMQDRNPHLDAIIEKIKNIKPEELAQETRVDNFKPEWPKGQS